MQQNIPNSFHHPAFQTKTTVPVDRIRPLHIIDSGGLYGAESVLLNLMDEQRRLGLDPMLASIGVPDCGIKPIETAAAAMGLKVRAFRMRAGPNLVGALRILRYARHNRCTLLHSHGYKGNILFGLMPRMVRGLPMVSTLHGYTAIGGNGFSRMGFYEFMDSISLRFIEQVVLVNKSMRNHKRLRGSSTQFKVVNNGVQAPTAPMTPIKSEGKYGSPLDKEITAFCSSGFIVGAISRLSPEKGIHLLLDAIGQAVLSLPALRLLIIGEGGQRNSLEDQVDSLGLKGKVMFAGFRPYASQYLPCMDVLALPSLTEGLPMVILEAMRARVPIIATRVGGVPEALEDGKAGFLVEKGCTPNLTRAILTLARNCELRRQIVDRAAQRVSDKYSSRSMTAGYLKIYKEIK